MAEISKMAMEVNKLIGGKLLSGEAVYLPEVGSLYITMSTSQRKRVEFGSAEQGKSLILIIMGRASCTTDEATEIFNRWLAEVRNESILHIEGVGELRAKSFITAESFAKQLNPVVEQPEEKVVPVVVPTPPKKVEPKPQPQPKPQPKPNRREEAKPVEEEEPKRKRSGWIAILLILLLIIVAIWFIKPKIAERKAKQAEVEAAMEAREQKRVADSLAFAEVEARRAAERLAASEQGSAEQELRFRVVYGVFRDQENVDRAIKDINSKFGAGSAKSYSFGGLTLVSMFESDNRAECQRFLMRNYDDMPDIWIYERK